MGKKIKMFRSQKKAERLLDETEHNHGPLRRSGLVPGCARCEVLRAYFPRKSLPRAAQAVPVEEGK